MEFQQQTNSIFLEFMTLDHITGKLNQIEMNQKDTFKSIKEIASNTDSQISISCYIWFEILIQKLFLL